MNFKKKILSFFDGAKETVFGVIFIFLLWAVIAYSGIVNQTLIASPGEVWLTMKSSFGQDSTKSQQIFIHFGNTILLAFNGWIISMVFGVIFGILLGQNDKLLSFLEPSIEMIRAIPPILAFPLFLVAHNYGIQGYVWTIVFGCLPITIITIAQGVKSINKAPFEVLELVKIKKWIKELLYLVQILPSLLLSARLSFAFSLIVAIVCEMVFTPRNGWALGALARDSELNFDTPMFYSCVLVIGIYGYLINRLFISLENRLT